VHESRWRPHAWVTLGRPRDGAEADGDATGEQSLGVTTSQERDRERRQAEAGKGRETGSGTGQCE
jgi:hypothetical protein